MQVREVRRWDQRNPATLRRYPGQYPALDSPREFELLREAYLHELQSRLDQLKHWERSRSRDVDGMQLEAQLSRIADYAGASTHDLYHGYANHIDWHFPPEQKRLLHRLLLKLEFDRPWRGVSLSRVFQYRENLRRRTEEA